MSTTTNLYFNTTINGINNTDFLTSTDSATLGALTCSSLVSNGTLSCGSNAATVGELSSASISSGTVTSSGTVRAPHFRINRDSAAAYSLLNAADSIEFGTLGHVAAASEFFSNSQSHDIILRNTTSGGRILIGVNNAAHDALAVITSSSLEIGGAISAGNQVNLMTVGAIPRFNSTTLSWSWQNSDGRTYLINQRGSGVGGFSFGLYDTDTSLYNDFFSIDARFNALDPYGSIATLGGQLNMYTSTAGISCNIFTPSMGAGQYNMLTLGKDGSNNAWFSYERNSTAETSVGNLGIWGGNHAISWDIYGRVGIGNNKRPGAETLEVDGNIKCAAISTSGGNMTIYKDTAATFNFMSSSNNAIEYGNFAHVQAATEFFPNSLKDDIAIRNTTPGGRILFGIDGTRAAMTIITSSSFEVGGIVKAADSFFGAYPIRYIDTSAADVNTTLDDYLIVITGAPANPTTHRVVVQPMSGSALTRSKTIYILNGSNVIARAGCQYSPSIYYADWNGYGNWAGYSDIAPGVMLKVFIYPNATAAHISTHDVVSCIAEIVNVPTTLSIDVSGFGATGNGTSDDTAALRNALNCLNGTSACVVNIPAGVYKITGVLPIPNNVSIVGAGIQKTIIRPLFTDRFEGVFVSKIIYDNHPVGSQTVGFKNISIQNLTVDIFANHVNPKNNVALPSYSYTNGCFWFYPPRTDDFTALLSDSVRRCKNLTIDKVEVIGGPYFSGAWTDRFGRSANGNWNFNLGGIDNLTITNCVLQGSGRDTLNVKVCNNVLISNNTIFDSEDDSIAIGDHAESNWYFNPAYGGEMAVYTFNGAVGGYDALIVNNVIKQGSAFGVKIFNQHNIIVANNIFKDMNYDAVSLDTESCDHVTVQGNVALRIGNYALSVLNLPSGGNQPFVGIHGGAHTVKHLMISNNTITTATSIFSCLSSSTCSYVIVAGNTIEGGTGVNQGSGSFTKYTYPNNITD